MFSLLISDGLERSGTAAEKLSQPPRLRESESNTSVIVIEWGESPNNLPQPILYEVVYTLTPFDGIPTGPVNIFVSTLYLHTSQNHMSVMSRFVLKGHECNS